MRILLIGEYSRLHNSLKEGLEALGHQVLIVGHGDGFKNFPVDIKLARKFDGTWTKKLKLTILKLFGFDISEYILRREFNKVAHRLKGFDVVQLINESPFQTTPKLEMEIVGHLKANNKKLFLLSCGADYTSVQHAYSKKIEPSIFTPLFEKKTTEAQMAATLKYLRPEYKKLHDNIYENINGVIASDLDYHLPLEGHPKYLGIIPNPVNVDRITPSFVPSGQYCSLKDRTTSFKEVPASELTGGTIQNKQRITIFHGINRINYYKKGNDVFEEALRILQREISEKIDIKTVESVPYEDYIKTYEQADIFLDQLYSQDQGYNALEAMAQGKVVFTGAGKRFKDHYGLKEIVALPAYNSPKNLALDLKSLVEQPERIKEIGRNARGFVVEHHHYVKVAKRYLEIWNTH